MPVIEKEVVVVVRFRCANPDGSRVFDDLITLTEEEHKSLSSAEVDARCEGRYANYITRTDAEAIARVHALTAEQIENQDRMLALAPRELAQQILRQQLDIVTEQLAKVEASSSKA